MLLLGWDSTTTFIKTEPSFLLLVSALAIVLHGGGERDCHPGSPVSKNKINSNPILALRFTMKILLPGWDSTTTFFRDEPAFLPLIAALAIVLHEGGERDCHPGSPFSKKYFKYNSNPILALRLTTKIFLPGWDLTTTFVRDEPAFLPLVAALAVVL